MAELNLKREFDIYKEIESDLDIAQNRTVYGMLLSYRGEFDIAYQSLELAESLAKKEHAPQTLSVISAFRALRAYLIDDVQTMLETAQQARTLADDQRVERDIIQAELVLGAALIMEGKDLNTANKHLTDALTRCRRINLVEIEPDILLAWARWHRAKGNVEEAQAYADEALAIADRCEFRLKQAEIHNFLARLALEVGDRKGAREHAETARERAWCDGPPHCYKPALDEAEGMLRELGAA